MDRVDTKFLVPASSVAELLLRCADRYRILEVRGSRLGGYRTRYFDTTDLRLYHDHHAGRVPRHKVRVRSYLNTQMRFLEVKHKTNKLRTLKARIPLGSELVDPLAQLREESFFGLSSAVDPSLLQQTLVVDYTRMTLVARTAPERITIDVKISFSKRDAARTFCGVAIAEVKQERHGHSHFRDALRALNLRPGGLSKYCLGIALLDSAARSNNFRQGIRRLEKMERDHLVLMNN
jgi:hypothetical protein